MINSETVGVGKRPYVVALPNNLANSIASNNKEYLVFLGANSKMSYYAFLHSNLFNLKLKVGERLEAHTAERKKLRDFLPNDFLPNLEKIIGSID